MYARTSAHLAVAEMYGELEKTHLVLIVISLALCFECSFALQGTREMDVTPPMLNERARIASEQMFTAAPLKATWEQASVRNIYNDSNLLS